MNASLEDLLRRYTSYPTAVEFHEGVGAETYRSHLERAARSREPLSLYVHLPFCEERCLFCGCNVVVTKRRDVAARYLDMLVREIDALAAFVGRRPVAQMHWGGGTPTYLDPDPIRRLHGAIAERFAFTPGAERGIEVDPRVTTRAHLETLRDLGFDRLSAGVQDFAADVQEAIGRFQTLRQTTDLVAEARSLGFASINLDLVYGLPRQTAEAFAASLDLVLELRPDRLAVYSYAHVPWMKGHQRKIPPASLPSPATKLALFTTAVAALTEGGYDAIGMDHFALPGDELARAARNGTLGRNFMGYTVHAAPDMVACGLSGIGDVAGAYVQNHPKLHAYEAAVARDDLAVERGYLLSDDDRLRREVIASLMCRFRLDLDDIGRRFGIDARARFAPDLERLQPMEEDGLVRRDEGTLHVTEEGRLFVRNVCMCFDAHLDKPAPARPRWSRTV